MSSADPFLINAFFVAEWELPKEKEFAHVYLMGCDCRVLNEMKLLHVCRKDHFKNVI